VPPTKLGPVGLGWSNLESFMSNRICSSWFFMVGRKEKEVTLNANSLLALDAQSGNFFGIHTILPTTHLLGWDPSAPPNLITILGRFKKILAVAQSNQTGLVFFPFSIRCTGNPNWFDSWKRSSVTSPLTLDGEETWENPNISQQKPRPFARQSQSLDRKRPTVRMPANQAELLTQFKWKRTKTNYAPPGLIQFLLLPGLTGLRKWGGLLRRSERRDLVKRKLQWKLAWSLTKWKKYSLDGKAFTFRKNIL